MTLYIFLDHYYQATIIDIPKSQTLYEVVELYKKHKQIKSGILTAIWKTSAFKPFVFNEKVIDGGATYKKPEKSKLAEKTEQIITYKELTK